MLLYLYTTFYATINHYVWQCMFELILVYWNWLSGKISISFTNKDVIYHCLQNFAWTNKTIINFILSLSHVLIDSSVNTSLSVSCTYKSVTQNGFDIEVPYLIYGLTIKKERHLCISGAKSFGRNDFIVPDGPSLAVSIIFLINCFPGCSETTESPANKWR